MGGQFACLLSNLHRAQVGRRPIDREAPATVGIHAHRSAGGVAVDDLDVIDRDAEHVAHDLGKGRLVPLTVRRAPHDHLDLAGEVKAHDGAAPQPDAGVGCGRGRRSATADLDIGRQPHTEVLALFAELRLATTDVGVAGELQRLVERWDVITRVVAEPGTVGVGKRGLGDEVLPTNLRRVHPDFLCEEIDRPLHGMRRLRPPGSAIGVGRRRVREDPDGTTRKGLPTIHTLDDQHGDRLEAAEHAHVRPQV